MSESESSPTSVEALLNEARGTLDRLTPARAHRAADAGAALIDIRSDEHRSRHGTIPAATYIPRNVLEWRCDPASPDRDAAIARRDRLVVIICDQGYQSSLAAATLRRFGLDATDVVGGFEAWSAQGLPVAHEGA